VPSALPRPRCALTAPFHPDLAKDKPCKAVCSLWHCPWGRPRRRLSGTASPWSPDFPPRQTTERPPGRLIRGTACAEGGRGVKARGAILSVDGRTFAIRQPQSVRNLVRSEVPAGIEHAKDFDLLRCRPVRDQDASLHRPGSQAHGDVVARHPLFLEIPSDSCMLPRCGRETRRRGLDRSVPRCNRRCRTDRPWRAGGRSVHTPSLPTFKRPA
jgi:hypothetical protein